MSSTDPERHEDTVDASNDAPVSENEETAEAEVPNKDEKEEKVAEAAPEVVMEAPAEEAEPEVAATTAESSDDSATEETAQNEQSPTPDVKEPKKGQRISVKLVQVGENTCFVDYGGRSEGAIATTELKNDDGELRFKEGESFQAVVKSSGESVVFTLGRKSAPPGLKKIQEALDAKIPLQGTVKATNKGGFEVRLNGLRAFCPMSQIERGFCSDPDQYVGKKLPFLVLSVERNGRNIVVSHRQLLEQEAASAAETTRETLAEGAEFEGVVRRLQPYGAFVDIGGLDGLVHVSQISHQHVRNPSDVLKVGEKVRVKVLKIDAPGTKDERISLSMKALEDDPWSDIATRLPVGTKVSGKVVRLANFGAFVELMPGVDGLVHISQIASERIDHPQDVLQVGQEVEAQVLDVDAEKQRVSLSLRDDPQPQRERSREGRPRRRQAADDGPREYTSAPEETSTPDVDVSDLEYSDAVKLLKQKFERS